MTRLSIECLAHVTGGASRPSVRVPGFGFFGWLAQEAWAHRDEIVGALNKGAKAYGEAIGEGADLSHAHM